MCSWAHSVQPGPSPGTFSGSRGAMHGAGDVLCVLLCRGPVPAQVCVCVCVSVRDGVRSVCVCVCVCVCVGSWQTADTVLFSGKRGEERRGEGERERESEERL